MSDLSEDYIAAWRRVLSGWLQWPEEWVQRFIGRWSDDMKGGDSIFFHDPPMYYVAPLLLPRALRERLGAEAAQMEHRLERAIEFRPEDIGAPNQFDWEAARERALIVLSEEGAQLPTPDEGYFYDRNSVAMTSSDALRKFGLPASPSQRAELRRLLVEEIEQEKQGRSGEEMLRTLCVQLFSLAVVEDALLIWAAKRSSFDARCGLDIQLLCGAGLAVTKEFLARSSDPAATAALAYLSECEQAGDFEDWTPQRTIQEHRAYYKL